MTHPADPGLGGAKALGQRGHRGGQVGGAPQELLRARDQRIQLGHLRAALRQQHVHAPHPQTGARGQVRNIRAYALGVRQISALTSSVSAPLAVTIASVRSMCSRAHTCVTCSTWGMGEAASMCLTPPAFMKVPRTNAILHSHTCLFRHYADIN